MTLTDIPKARSAPRSNPHHRWERVASFATPERAALAVVHLVDLQHEADHIAITATRIEAAPDPKKRRLLRRGAQSGAILAGVGAALVSLLDSIGAAQLLFTLLPVIAIAAAVGAVVGLLATYTHYRRTVAWVSGTAHEYRQITMFDVVVDRDPNVARQDLARWWNPDAPTVPEAVFPRAA